MFESIYVLLGLVLWPVLAVLAIRMMEPIKAEPHDFVFGTLFGLLSAIIWPVAVVLLIIGLIVRFAVRTLEAHQ